MASKAPPPVSTLLLGSNAAADLTGGGASIATLLLLLTCHFLYELDSKLSSNNLLHDKYGGGGPRENGLQLNLSLVSKKVGDH